MVWAAAARATGGPNGPGDRRLPGPVLHAVVHVVVEDPRGPHDEHGSRRRAVRGPGIAWLGEPVGQPGAVQDVLVGLGGLAVGGPFEPGVGEVVGDEGVDRVGGDAEELLDEPAGCEGYLEVHGGQVGGAGLRQSLLELDEHADPVFGAHGRVRLEAGVQPAAH